jgi:hypothetical protein
MFDLKYFLHYIIMLSAHAFAYSLGHTEPEFEEPTEQVQVEESSNLVWIKASPGVSINDPCPFTFESCSMFIYDYALSLYELYGTIVTL